MEVAFEALRDRGNNLLLAEPEGVSEAIVFWKMLKPLDLTVLRKFWLLADPKEKRLELKRVSFTTWTDNDGLIYTGMKEKDTGLSHGVVRVIKPDKWVSERTYRKGQIHGLSRQVSKDSVRVMLFKDGEEIAFFVFGLDRLELERGGSSKYLLAPIKPDMFLKSIV